MEFSRKELKELAREKLEGNWGLSIGVSFVAMLLGAHSGGGGSGSRSSNLNWGDIAFTGMVILLIVIVVALVLLLLIIGGAVKAGENVYYMHLIKGEEKNFSDLFSRMPYVWNFLGLRFMIGLFSCLWALPFVVPGVIALLVSNFTDFKEVGLIVFVIFAIAGAIASTVAAIRYSQAMYIKASDPDVGVMDAIARSCEMMKGRKMEYFMLTLSFIGWALLCVITLFIGFLWLVPYVQATLTAYYLKLSESDATEL